MSEHWTRKPKIVGANAARLRLSREERFLIARIDGRTSLAELGNLTGLGAERVGDLVAKLQGEGALSLPEAAPNERIVRREPPKPKEETWTAPILRAPEPEPEPQPEPEPEPEPVPEPAAPIADPELPEAVPALADAFEEPATEAPAEAEAAAPAEEAAAEEDEKDFESRAEAERTYRALYEKKWASLTTDQRAAGAKEARGTDLQALCFDPEPSVIASLLENASIGLDHVRLIAQHHRTTTGLEIVSRRSDWLRDMLVERRLLRNPMIGEIVLNRVMNPKLLLHTYKIAIDRDIPDISRVKVRAVLKTKWAKAPPEQRAELLQRTEARCLILMTGCTFDAKTTGILCGRPINSAMFVQSIAKFGAAPPALLAHLLKQPFVRKNQALKKMLISHPNTPGDAKRNA
jgi:hypothetical protein